MAYFPMFIDLEKKNVLIVGGGMVALRKVQKLLSYGAKITVMASEIVDKMKNMDGIEIEKRSLEPKDIQNGFLKVENFVFVIAATDDKTLNMEIAKHCRERNVPVNVVDNQEQCSFIFPALVQKGNFSVGVSTGGASPTAAIYYKERIQEMVPDNIEEILDWLEEKRQKLKKQIPKQEKRAGIFRKLFDACLEKGRPLTEVEMKDYIEEKNVGSVALVGAVSGTDSKRSKAIKSSYTTASHCCKRRNPLTVIKSALPQPAPTKATLPTFFSSI